METYLLRIFQRQVLIQCEFMLRASDDISSALSNRDVRGVFYAIQNFLTAAANVSKALWGQRGQLSAQRKPLRDSIGILDASPLREVAMRNNFEHFDERIDRWWRNSPSHNFVDSNIGRLKVPNEIDSFRNFDPRTTDISFWGQTFNLRKLVDEVRTILPKLKAEAEKPHW